MTTTADDAEAVDLAPLDADYWHRKALDEVAEHHHPERYTTHWPDEDAPLPERLNALHAVLEVAQMVRTTSRGLRPGELADVLIKAVEDVYAQRPEPVPAVLERKTSSADLVMAGWASKIAHDPALVERIPDDLVRLVDGLLGSATSSPEPPLRAYFQAVADAREALAAACEDRLRWVAAERRRSINAPTREESAILADAEARMPGTFS